MVHFAIEGAHAETDETRELAKDVGAEGTEQPIGVSEDEAVDRRPLRRRARASRTATTVEVAVDTRALHFFDPETGLGIYDGITTKGAPCVKRQSSMLVARARRSRVARGCGSSDGEQPAATTTKHATSAATSRCVGVWTGAEQKHFQAVLDGFKKKNPDVKVKYTSAGDNTPTVLSTAVAGRQPARPRVGLAAGPREATSQKKGALKPIDFAKAAIAKNYPPSGSSSAPINGKLYGLVFKGANKSTVWYNVKAFKNAGVKPPRRGTSSSRRAKTLKASGTPAYSIGGADGWTLTDLFENIYLRQAGPAKYDQLSTHKIKWTDPSVTTALKTMAQVLGDTSNIAGGTSGALQTDFPTSVNERLRDAAEGGDGDRGRLRARRRRDDEGEAGHGLQRVPVPVDQRLAGRRSSAAATPS